MKEIKAIIRPFRIDAVLDELRNHTGLPGVTISEVHGFGKTVGRGPEAGAGKSRYGTARMVKLECVVNDDMLDEVLELIASSAQTERPGDGKIIVCDVREIVKIRTGERSDQVT